MTAKQLAAKMKRRAAAVEPEFRRATQRLGLEAVAFCRQKLTELIYSQPIPKRPRSGKPMWRRTGFLRRSERLEIRDSYTAAVVNDATYALPRHEAGKPGRRPTRFPAHWRDEMVKAFREKVTTAYREALLRILRQGGL